jgi:hypothetical protein
MTTFANRNSQIPLREIKKSQIEGHRSNDTTIGIGIKKQEASRWKPQVTKPLTKNLPTMKPMGGSF